MHVRRASHGSARPLNCGVRRQPMRHALFAFLAGVAVFALLGAVLCVAGIPTAFARREAEPEDLHLSLFWVSLCSIVFAYCVVAAVGSTRGRTSRIGIV